MYATSRYLHELKLKGCTVKSNGQPCIIMLASVLTVPICLFSKIWGGYALPQIFKNKQIGTVNTDANIIIQGWPFDFTVQPFSLSWQTPDDRRAPSQTTEQGISP